jgi:hypothetical protein
MKAPFLVAALALLATTLQEDEARKPRRPAVGEMAPTLRLNDHTGNIVALGGEQDRWTVLAFFPKAATPG